MQNAYKKNRRKNKLISMSIRVLDENARFLEFTNPCLSQYYAR